MKASELKLPATPTLPRGDFEVGKAQSRAIERAMQQAWEYDSLHNPDKHEFKEFELYPLGAGKTIVIRSVVGMKDDENTAASIFCRYRRQLFVGPQGKLSTYGKGGKKLTGIKALIYGADR